VPPEQIADARNVDERADIYSLGATAYHLLSGEHPFRGQTVSDLAMAIRSEQPRPLRAWRDDVPPVLDQIILRAMAKLPDQRFATAAEMNEALKTVRL
jgi:serine/threonine protein kinase